MKGYKPSPSSSSSPSRIPSAALLHAPASTVYGVAQSQDGVSTSSSTLVNAEHEERARRRMFAHASTATASGAGSTLDAPRPSTLRRSAAEKSTSERQMHSHPFPDDHRCSDQEIEGGLCGCMRAASQSSESEAAVSGKEEDAIAAAAYQRKLFLARKRKILLDNLTGVSNDQGASATYDRLDSARKQDVHVPASDPPSVSPTWAKSRRRPAQQRRASSPIRVQSPPGHKQAQEKFSASVSHVDAHVASPSAARRSISTVYERLLREEEERREEERRRKEAARLRRRTENLRRKEDSILFERLTRKKEDVVQDHEEGIAMPPYTSPLLSVSPPSTYEISFDSGQTTKLDGAELLHPFDITPAASKTHTLHSAHPERGRSLMIGENVERGDHGVSHTERSKDERAASTEQKRSTSPQGIASPASSDSVRSFTFPARAEIVPTSPSHHAPASLSPTPSLLSLNVGSSPTPHSPRRNGHRRGPDRGGQHDTISVSLRTPRTPSSSEAIIAAQLNENFLPSPSNEEQADRSGTGTRRVKFSPQPEIINIFSAFTKETDGTDEPKIKAENEAADVAVLPQIAMVDAVNEENKIDLDVIASNNTLDIDSPRPLRGSPMKRTTASPRFPGTYFSPASGVKGRTLSASPPLHGAAPTLGLQKGGPPRSRSWNANLSTSDASISGELGVVEEDKVTEGSVSKITSEDSISTQSVPLTSTPPRVKKTKHGVSTREKGGDGLVVADEDDSLRMTLDQLSDVLRKRKEESRDTSMQTDEVPHSLTHSDAIDILANVDTKQDEETAKFRETDREFVRRLDAARRRLATMTRTYKRSDHVQQSTAVYWTLIGCAFVVLQLVLASFMIAAAHAKSEQMFFAVYRRYDVFVPDAFLLPPRTFVSLVQAVLIRWNLLPDLGQIAGGQHDPVARSWPSFLPWAVREARRQGRLFGPLRLIITKFAYQSGMYSLDVVPLGHSMPS